MQGVREGAEEVREGLQGEATVLSFKGSDHCLSFCFSAFPCGSTALTSDRCHQNNNNLVAGSLTIRVFDSGAWAKWEDETQVFMSRMERYKLEMHVAASYAARRAMPFHTAPQYSLELTDVELLDLAQELGVEWSGIRTFAEVRQRSSSLLLPAQLLCLSLLRGSTAPACSNSEEDRRTLVVASCYAGRGGPVERGAAAAEVQPQGEEARGRHVPDPDPAARAGEPGGAVLDEGHPARQDAAARHAVLRRGAGLTRQADGCQVVRADLKAR
eukprot:SAG22_NODE_302_length_12743_cov_12.397738_18_plen_271_part_00